MCARGEADCAFNNADLEMRTIALLTLAIVSGTGVLISGPPSEKLLIAHRGASAYAPEHTLAAYRLAIDQGADLVEQDLVITKDGVLVCLHDTTLERTTNVEDVFPDRFDSAAPRDVPADARRWFVYDFTLAEIKGLDAGGWFDTKFAGARVLTWQEAIDVVHGKAGLCPELKSPEVYRRRGVNMVRLVVDSIRKNGLDRPASARAFPLILQSFDEPTLRELARELPDIPRVFLMESEQAAHWMSANRVREIARFATMIGPNKTVVENHPRLVSWAHDARLMVLPYTFGSRDGRRFSQVRDQLAHFLFTLGVDGAFTDNPDRFPRKPPA